MTTQPPFVAELNHAREVSLLGTADSEPWAVLLQREGLVPVLIDGRVQILIVAVAARFAGVPFREVSISVRIHPPSSEFGPESAMLVRAFHSCRLFAFCERALFATPYEFADCRLSIGATASIQVIQAGTPRFVAAMGIPAMHSERVPSSRVDGGWDGAVFLPTRRDTVHPGKWFRARLHGEAVTVPFLNGVDSVVIGPTGEPGVFRLLHESKFAGREWSVRTEARHARSKTYTRGITLPAAAMEGGVA